MAYIPKMDQIGPVVALIAAVLDSRDTGGNKERAREIGLRIGELVAQDPADFVTTAAFVGAALAELAAEGNGISPEEVLAAVLEAGSHDDSEAEAG